MIILKMTNYARRAYRLCTKLCLYLEHCPPRPQVLVIGRFSNRVETIKERRREWWWSHDDDDDDDDDDDNHLTSCDIRSVRSVRSLKRRPRVHSADYHIMRQRSRSLEQVALHFTSDWGWLSSCFAHGLDVFWCFLVIFVFSIIYGLGRLFLVTIMNDGSCGDRVIFVAFIDDASWRGVGWSTKSKSPEVVVLLLDNHLHNRSTTS